MNVRQRPAHFAAFVLMLGTAVLAGACGSSDDEGPATDDDGSGLVEALADQRPAEAPFEGMGVIDIVVGDTPMTVVVADDVGERSAGLRDRTDPAPYDGMLFAHSSDTETKFTMSGVDEDLDIEFYDADGNPLGGHEMVACPSGRDCDSYPSPGPFRYALETPPGQLPEGILRGL